jgi:hypothetical protein
MDIIADDLGKTADSVYVHNLKAQLGVAIRSSNAQYHEPEFLNRLDVNL